jgi:D-beta-D-heptose 7-phosphate kinase/D-beta-D-heptose 1-phosphate adenosyltransferase
MALLPPIAPERGRRLAGAFSGAHVLVLGDAMLDRFIVGLVTRLSPEAPVPVVAFDHETSRIGGAANVAHNVTALGGQATLIAVTGQDEASSTLARACHEAGISPAFISDPSRQTTTKVRIVTERKHQVARIDYESDQDITGQIEDRVITAVHQQMSLASAVVISDYLKGSITRRVMAAVMTSARSHGVPVLVDPKIPHLDYYAGADVVTPNHHEAEAATHMRVRNEEEARASARVFRDRTSCATVMMTRGDQGVWLLGPDVEGHLPAVGREVADVTGAGDTVIATMALALASGATLTEAARLANEAAGLSVSKFGPAVVSPEELLAALAASADI